MAEQNNDVVTEVSQDQVSEADQTVQGEQVSDSDQASEQAEQTPTQTVTVKEIGPAARELTIEVPQEVIQEKIDKSYNQLNQDAAIPGFRKGHVPRKLIERRFNASVREDVKAQVISEAYSQAIEDQKLDVIGEPDVKDAENLKLPEEGSLVLTVNVEISPEVTLPDFSTLEVDEVVSEVTEEDVQKEIESLQDHYGSMEPMDEGAVVQEKDFVQAHVRILAGKDASDDAEEISHHHDVYIMVNGASAKYKGHVVGIVVEDLGKQLAGKKVSDELRISMTGPTGHEDEKIKDQEITLVIRIDQIQRVTPVELDKLAAMLGAESEEALHTRIREDLEARAHRKQISAQHDQLRDQLVEKVELVLPEKVAGNQIARALKNEALRLAYEGKSEQEVEQEIAERRTATEDDARRNLKLFFILDRAAKDLDIEVSAEEINGRIAMMAMMRQTRPEKLRKQMQQSGEIQNVYLSMREQKTLDKILELAKIKGAEDSADKTSSDASDSGDDQ